MVIAASQPDQPSYDDSGFGHGVFTYNLLEALSGKADMDKLACPRYLVSTNGNIFEHPDAEAIARIIKYGDSSPRIFFNYLSERTNIWKEESRKRYSGFSVRFPDSEKMGIIIDL
jgi:1,2-phenylacetyl-CoA epoxidase catalytic subunit